MSREIVKNIDWVGAIDWTVRDFHGYETFRGTTYNAYLLRDEKTTLIDSVKAPFAGKLLEQVAAMVDLAQVKYVVCNHAEPDHAGALPEVLHAMPQAVLLCNRKCAATLAEYFPGMNWNIQAVADGRTVSIGRRSLQFFETPMVHWPESMCTYVPEEKLLFSMDIFGQHRADSERFDDEVEPEGLMYDAKSYYANIVMPYDKAVRDCLTKFSTLQIDIAAPSHGLIWRSEVREIISAYSAWANHRVRPKVLVLYDTMWGATGLMAEAIAAGAMQPGVSVSLLNVRREALSRIATEVLEAAALAVGSATLNRSMMPMLAAVLAYLEGLRPLGKVALAFGTYGWGRGGAEAVAEAFNRLQWEQVAEPLRARWRPSEELLAECRRVGKLLAERAAALAQD